jgi:hypothetical protein
MALIMTRSLCFGTETKHTTRHPNFNRTNEMTTYWKTIAHCLSLLQPFFESPHVLDQCKIAKQCEKLANFYNKDLSSEELTSECLHFKSCIKLDMKSLMESKNVFEDTVKEEECINIHYIYIYIQRKNFFNFSKC